MEMKPQLTPALETGLMSATASFQDPEVTLSASDGDAPALCIEEAGVAVELEFPDVECVLCFQQRVAPLRLSERPATALPSGGNNAPAPRGEAMSAGTTMVSAAVRRAIPGVRHV